MRKLIVAALAAFLTISIASMTPSDAGGPKGSVTIKLTVNSSDPTVCDVTLVSAKRLANGQLIYVGDLFQYNAIPVFYTNASGGADPTGYSTVSRATYNRKAGAQLVIDGWYPIRDINGNLARASLRNHCTAPRA